jgi:hypothetical protein
VRHARTLANKSNGKIQAVCAGWDDESPTGAQTHHRRHLQQVRVCRQCATLAGVNMLTDEQAFHCRWQPFCW